MNAVRSLLARAKVVASSVVTHVAAVGAIAAALAVPLGQLVPSPFSESATSWALAIAAGCATVVEIVRRVTPVIDQAIGLFPEPGTAPSDWVGDPHPTTRQEAP